MSGDDHARLSDGLAGALRRPWKLTDATRMSVDAFAERYAQSRGLSYEITADTPRDPWFLSVVWAKRSHSFMRGQLAGGADGLLLYVEKLLRGGRSAVREGWTAARYEIPAARDLAQGIACVPRQGPVWGGRLKLASVLPQELTTVAVGDAKFDGSHEVGVISERDHAAVQAIFTPDFIAWMRGLPLGNLGNESTRFEVRAGALCVYTKGTMRTTATLDEFCKRAARIAAQVHRAAAAGRGGGTAPPDSAETPSGNGVREPQDEIADEHAEHASGEPGSVAPAQPAVLHYTASAADAIRAAGTTDSHLGADFIEATVRRIIAAWATAVAGDEAALAAVARPEAVHALLHPARAGKRTRLVAGGLRVTYIMVDRLQADTQPPVLGISLDCAGLWYIEDLDTGSVLSGDPDSEAPFVQLLYLKLDGPEPWPWRVYSGDIRTLTPPLDYTFSFRRETPGEYRERTGAAAIPPHSARPVQRFRIRADFAEHDERLGGSVTFVVERETAPTRDEAAALAYPAILAETIRSLGEGDWRPSLSGLDMRELLD